MNFKKRGSKAQVSVEYLIIAGFALLMVIPIVIVFFTQANEMGDSLSISQARSIAKKIAETSEAVYYQGYPSQKTLTMYFPTRIDSIDISSNEINFRMDTLSGMSDVFASTVVNMSGTISPEDGIKRIKILASGNQVNITEI